MSDLDGNGSTIQLADGPHAIRFKMRRMHVIEKRYGGMSKLQDLIKEQEQYIEILGALLWASGKGETEDEAMDAADGMEIASLLNQLMEQYIHAYAGEDAINKAKAAAADANGSAPDPTAGASAPVEATLVPSPSMS